MPSRHLTIAFAAALLLFACPDTDDGPLDPVTTGPDATGDATADGSVDAPGEGLTDSTDDVEPDVTVDISVPDTPADTPDSDADVAPAACLDCGDYTSCGPETDYACVGLVDACVDDADDVAGYCAWSSLKDSYEVCRDTFSGDAAQIFNCTKNAGSLGSDGCATCFVGLAQCAWTACVFDCFLSDPFVQADCNDCVAADCADAWACTGNPECVCVPDCDDKLCGPDGCGGSCGSCEVPGEVCNETTGLCQCQPDCTDKQCGDDGCGGECGPCVQGTCNTDDFTCECAPDCSGKVCGSDGCGGECGTPCPTGTVCSTDQTQCECAPDCSGKVCGPDGCGGSCGVCQAAGDVCVAGLCSGAGTCSSPIVLSSILPTTFAGDSSSASGAVNSSEYNSDWCAGDTNVDYLKGWDSPDRVHLFVAPTSASFTVTLTPVDPNDPGDTFDAVLYVVTECDDVQNTCVQAADDAWGPGTTNALQFVGTAGVSYFIIVDGRDYPYQVGPYTLAVE